MRPIHLVRLLLPIAMSSSPARSEWTTLEIPTGESMNSLWFTNASTGFMAGGSVWRTDDGAATWNKIEIPSGLYQEIRFRDALTGFIAGTGTLLKTTDGGNQWQPIGQVPQSFKKLALTGETVYGLASGGRRLWKSADGGLAWDTLGDIGAIVNHLAFPDSQSGFVSNQRDIYKSSDGGKQWRKVYSIRSGGLITDLQFLNPDTGYATGYYPGSILSTYDGGETWKEVPAKFWIYGMYFSDTRRGCVVGNLAEVMRTADAGATWLPETTGGMGIFKDLHFPTADVGYILGTTALLKFSNPPTSIRPAKNPIRHGRSQIRYFDIRGSRLPSHPSSGNGRERLLLNGDWTLWKETGIFKAEQ